MLRNYIDKERFCFYRDLDNHHKYFVEQSGEVYFTVPNDPRRHAVEKKEENGMLYVYIKPLGKWIRVANIVNYAYKGLYHDVFDELMEQEITFLDGNPANVHPSNLIWNNGNSKEDEEGFRIIPGFVRHRINRKGEIKNERGGITCGRLTKGSGSAGAKDYMKVHVKADVSGKDREYVLIGVHRLLALAFLHIPNEFYKMDVSHLNDDSLDNRIENLEWATRRSNNLRAVQNGAVKTNPVLARNFQTGEVLEFPSICQCARYFNVHPTRITTNCKSKGQVTFSNGYQFCLKSDLTGWGDTKPNDHQDYKQLTKTVMNDKRMKELLGIEFPLRIFDKAKNESVYIETLTEYFKYFKLDDRYVVVSTK